MRIASYLRVFILLFFLVALACACDTTNSENTCPAEEVETSTYLEVKPLQYKGHRYLWFRSKLRKGFGGVTHDPDCKCLK